MRRFVFAGMVVSVLASVGPAVAQTAAAPATPAVAPAAPATPADDADRVVCRMSPAHTGSRLGSSRECHTQKQWDQMRLEAQRNVSNMQTRGMESSPPGK